MSILDGWSSRRWMLMTIIFTVLIFLGIYYTIKTMDWQSDTVECRRVERTDNGEIFYACQGDPLSGPTHLYKVSRVRCKNYDHNLCRADNPFDRLIRKHVMSLW